MSKLVKANIRKDRAVLIAFLFIIVLSSMLLHLGLFVNRYDALYDEKKETGGIGDAEVYAYGKVDVIQSVMDGLSEVSGYTMSDIIRSDELTLISEEKNLEENREDVVLHSIKDLHASHCTMMEQDETLPGPHAYLNLYYATSNNFKIGDHITLNAEGLKKTEYTVAGIYEDCQQGNTYSWCSICLDEDSFREQWKLAEDASAKGVTFMDQHELVSDFPDAVSDDDGLKAVLGGLEEAGVSCYGFTMSLAKTGYVSVTNILAAFMTVFSLIAMLVCLVMIIFTINNNIDRDVRNIGALRAVGHTNKQIRTSLLLEYLVVGTVGAGVGIGLAYVLMPVIDKSLLRSVTGMFWENRVYPCMSSIVLGGVLLAMTLVVFLSTRRLKNLHPATALRFGLQSNSFKKNHLPLATTKGRLNPLLAAKSMLQSMGQNMIVLGIVAVVSFMTIFSAILFYNTRVDISRFQTLVSGDVADGVVMLNTSDETEVYRLRDQIAEIPGVSQAYCYDWHNISVDGHATFTFYTDRPEYLDCGVYEGQMFQEANEAVIGRILAEKLNVKIGDEIEVECAGTKARYIVTGFQQSVMNLGERVFLTTEGLKRLGIDPEFTSVRIRLEDANDSAVEDTLAKAKVMLGEFCTGVDNVYRYQRSTDNLTMFASLMLILLLILVNVAIIYLVIKLLLKTIFIRKEKEFGIKKAVGFTSRQLRLQLAMSLFPVALIAAGIGAVLGFFLVNPLISVVLGGFGVASADFLIYPFMILLTIVLVVLLVFGMTYLMSGRMKRVSAYDLIQE
ncbi:MAG: ABC transporter permease [Eubacterium sp.]|nr:ABC transporter permease [Eubacterium sp.]